jgi:preprotein translocase subunit SecB
VSDNGERKQGSGNGGAGERHFVLEKIYVKDLSFEAPNAPAVHNEDQSQTQINMDLKNSHQKLDDDVYEVCLHVTLHATVGERTLFMVELDQAGLFQIHGYDDNELRQLIAANCPATLYPYCREAISATIGRGGFPSILLQPINFDALFARAQAEQREPDA